MDDISTAKNPSTTEWKSVAKTFENNRRQTTTTGFLLRLCLVGGACVGLATAGYQISWSAGVLICLSCLLMFEKTRNYLLHNDAWDGYFDGYNAGIEAGVNRALGIGEKEAADIEEFLMEAEVAGVRP
jgi:hypothetical protein